MLANAVAVALVAIYVYEWTLDASALRTLFAGLALVPREVTLVWRYPAGVHGHARLLELLQSGIAPLLSYALLHAGVMHLLGNVLFLRLFAGTVERLAGAARLAVILLGGTLAAAIAQVLADPMRAVPTAGASGTVFALAGAFFVRCGHARILLAIPVVVWPVFVEMPAWLLGIVFAALQVPPVLDFAAPGEVGATAWAAHLGGLLFGLAAGLLLVPRPPARPRDEAASVGGGGR